MGTALCLVAACSYEGTRPEPVPFVAPPSPGLADCPKTDSSIIVGEGHIVDVALAGDDVFWLDGNAVRRWHEGETTTLARVDGVPLRVIADGEFVFVSHPGGATIASGQARDASLARVTIPTGEVREILPTYPETKRGSVDLAFWRERLVYTTYDGTLRSLPRDGSTPAQIMWAGQRYPNGFDVALRSLEVSGDIALHRPNAGEPPVNPFWVDLARMVDPNSAVTGKIWWQANLDAAEIQPARPLFPPLYPRELRMQGGLLHLLDAERIRVSPLEQPALAVLACGRGLTDLVTAPGYVAWIENGTEVHRLAMPQTSPAEPARTPPIEPAMPPDASPRTVVARVYLDAASHLYLSGKKMWWHHTLERPPGWGLDGVLRPSEIDGVPWAPAFAFSSVQETLPGLGPYTNNCNCNSQPLDLPWTLPRAPQVVSVELTKGRARAEAFVAQQPSAANDYTAIISLQEEGVTGQAWVEIELRLLATP